MKAVRIHEYGGPEVLVYEEVPRRNRSPTRCSSGEGGHGQPVDVAVRENAVSHTQGAAQDHRLRRRRRSSRRSAPRSPASARRRGLLQRARRRQRGQLRRVRRASRRAGRAEAAGAVVRRGRGARSRLPHRLLRLVKRGGLREGETVLIQGARRRRRLRLRAARQGASAPALSERSRRRRKRTSSRASAPTSRSTTATEDVAERVAELTDGRGVDLIHELVISVNLPPTSAWWPKRGRIVCTGQGPDPEARVPIGEALGKDVDAAAS